MIDPHSSWSVNQSEEKTRLILMELTCKGQALMGVKVIIGDTNKEEYRQCNELSLMSHVTSRILHVIIIV